MDWFEYSFEKLEAWKKAKTLTKAIYLATKSFPREEQFGLTQQIRRAAISVVSNIAEGAGRKTANDRANFYMIAYSSLLEITNQVILAFELEYLNPQEYAQIRKCISETSFLVNALYKSQRPPT